MGTHKLLEVSNLSVEFETYGGVVKAVRGVDFSVDAGEVLAIVGESGCGKSVTVQSIMGIIPMPPGKITGGSAKLKGEEILGLQAQAANQFRGKEIGMIFQDPMTSLNPTMTIGAQIAETLKVHRGLSTQQASEIASELLIRTRIPEAQKRLNQYPFEFSGGMLQRAMIAQSLACSPSLLIADEPTTALDVTIQAQILDLLKELQSRDGMAIILITHDLAVVARTAQNVCVMYAGQIVEQGSVDDIFYKSAHPYTLGLKLAMPSNVSQQNKKLEPIPGSPPDLFSPPSGCGYAARCPHAMRICHKENPPLFSDPREPLHAARCWLQAPGAPKTQGLYQPNLIASDGA
ncbi:ABC transporter ATP-binding protein [Pseudomonadales bacterium]|jgi:oligopeptide/dipeptide ABC transporter ATP-binding protein|nr:ABC transporter ATP-binding protein [Gammaproteobacteria bacterium]MDA0825740.1 ABC transporter ATP-binding protein [Pseudomonadota bacterium]MDC1101196.1 ABC transporter ATP-binding protein [Pseudomonadales bacterium]MBT6792915.1 ABC transporter ATP-binding protein [Gammaproteobacteria bacterium]MBT7885742.1 ABC transporter ATP-binding protein [Gammaproteobacteria bacterium]